MICDGSVPNEVYFIIGNGFDIECGLPTDYKSFLKFLKSVDNCLGLRSERKSDRVRAGIGNNLADEIRTKLLDTCEDDLLIWQPVLNSYWYTLFESARVKNSWVDFENEISKTISKVEDSMYLKEEDRLLAGEDYVIVRRDSELNALLSLFLKDSRRQDVRIPEFYMQYEISYRDLAKRLLDDLNLFIGGFEKYLLEYVSLIKPNYNENIRDLISKLKLCSDNYILTFNYTDTLEKMVREEGINADFCYVHGKAGSKRNNMVLGIDEHLKPDEIAKYIQFAPFRKYNQRIFKETDSHYVDWIKHMNSQKTIRHHLYIFGHSLGQSDKDILRPFILSPLTDTFVYYYRLDAFSKLVGNMTAIIDMDNMIRMNGGTERTMAFLPQATV